MWKQKIGFSVTFPADNQERAIEIVKLIRQTGFDAISPVWNPDIDFDTVINSAKECGLEIQSIHAPFRKIVGMWSTDAAVSDPVKSELNMLLNKCRELSVPILVVHVWKGFNYTFPEDPLYFDNFDEIVNTARECGVKIAFENTEGEEYLFALMDRYEDCDCVGFCWDSGHEMCYNHSQDLLAKYGDRLLITHLNDNLGISRFDGKTFWTDDLHLLPYDGIADWDYNIDRLRKSKPLDILNFELARASKRDRHDNDVYTQMPLEQYYAEVYKRACKIAYRYSK